MATANREAAIKLTLGYEGGYSNDAADPGGPTNFGITIFDARKYWKPNATANDVKQMPIEVAVDIYRQHYWAPMNCDADPMGVDFVTFDYGVNSGVGRAVPCRSKNKQASIPAWVKGICADRLVFLEHLKIWASFGRGWGKRVADVEARGVKMALQAEGSSADEVKKSLNDESTAAKATATKEITKAGGTVVATGSTQVPSTPIHLDPTSLPWWALAILGLGVLVAVVVFVWRYKLHQQRAAAYAAVAKES